MSLLESTLNDAMRQIVNSVISADFAIKAKQNAPRPNGSYASVDVMSIVRRGYDEQILTDRIIDLDIDSDLIGFREINYSIQFYRDNAISNAMKLQQAIARYSVNEFLNAAKLGLGRRSDVRDISAILENGYEERAQIDITLHAIDTDQEIIRSIQGVTISGIYETRDQQIPITIEV